MNFVEELLMNALGSLQPWSLDTDKKLGYELELFRSKNFNPMGPYLRDLFPNSCDQIRLRNVPLASKVADDGAGQYPEAPRREFRGGSDVQVAVMRDYYRMLGVDPKLLMAERQGVLQQAYLLGLWPDERGVLRLLKFLPYHVMRIEYDSPWAQLEGNISEASLVELAVPLNNKKFGAKNMLRVVLTPDQAWCIWPNGGERGLLNDNGSNPLGRVPLVATRREEPPDGGYLPTVAHDVHSCQVGIVLGLSDAEAIARHTIIVSLVASGEGTGNMPAAIPLRAGLITPLPPGVTVTPIHQTPAIEKYLQAACGMTMKYLTMFRNLRPQGYEASIITGPAANIDREGFLEERRRQEIRCEKLEQDLADLIVDVHNAYLPRALKLSTMRTQINWRYVRSRENILQESQSLAVRIGANLWSVVEEVADERGISTDEALELIEKRHEWAKVTAANVSQATPGLDKSVPAPTA